MKKLEDYLYYEEKNPDLKLYNGDCLEILPLLGMVDAVVTDPPYSSGGFTRSDRTADPSEKYVQTGTDIIRASFTGDNRDGRSWCYWMALWISEVARHVIPPGYCLIFTDWRQLPLCSDALQAGGFVWRGLISWDKGLGSRAPHTGYFRHQCEYVVWGGVGVSKPSDYGGPWPGSFTIPVVQSDKHHMTGKPTKLIEQLLACVRPGGVVLDPFAGSGTTLVAAKQARRAAIGIEISKEYCEVAKRRLQNTTGTLF